MRGIKYSFWIFLAALTALWLVAEPRAFAPSNFFAFRSVMMQYTGILAIGCMSLAMMLALRPRWPEPWFGGLDKMYRLHKWLGIGALVIAISHWLWANGPRWAVGFGVLERSARGPRPPAASQVEQTLASLRHSAEQSGGEMQARIADLEEKLARADRIIVSALASSVSLGDMSKKLQSAHAD